ncbi:polysaccharide deacetylase family protein [Winogradskyella forsetii]|uniref:polysaccharide deacetylase family protein n=1 Tax=Winogradskyella forsetii TaxID=2686077 RepID=UPI0015B9A452|nr:polysaccharide deacetylase family protein [Winogradskyella forsetii]
MTRLPILMYHNVSNDKNSNGLTIWANNLEDQFKYLKDNGFESFHFSELENFTKNKKSLPKKSVVITFDDVYVNQLELAYPLLKKYNLKATFFIPFEYVDAVDSWNTNEEKIMSVAQLKSMDADIIELGLHSFHHNNYNDISISEIEKDFEACYEFIEQHNLKVENILAYPYGKYPRKNPKQREFFNQLKQQHITYGLRIGNRVNRFPFKDNYQVQRIDIKGEDSLKTFKLKLKFGKLRLF